MTAATRHDSRAIEEPATIIRPVAAAGAAAAGAAAAGAAAAGVAAAGAAAAGVEAVAANSF